MTNTASNADPREIEKFAALASEWWDPRGPFRPLHAINPVRLEFVRSRMALRGARILDVGCGGGLFAEALAREGAQVTGIDMAAASIDAARTHAAQAGLEIRYECGDIESFCAAHREEFDAISCFELLEHVPEPGGIITACSAALKRGGGAFFSTINRNPKSFLLAIVAAEHVLGWVPRGSHEYLKLVRPSALAAWCRTAGLDLGELAGLHFNPLRGGFRMGRNVDVNYFAHAVKPLE